MDGILPVYKPAGVTSHDVVAQLRRLLHMKKIGHSGTLDPSVDGVLPIALGAATKAVPELMAAGKTYTGAVTFGFATETEDLDGATIARQTLTAGFSDAQIDAAMAQLTGTITQIPPMYSAVKVNGRKLYEYARAGETVERPKRQVTVYRFARTKPAVFDAVKGKQHINFIAEVSKGTYIRTLAVAVGRQLQVPAVMSQLTRIASGGFTLDQTLDLRPLTPETAPAAVAAQLRPIEYAYAQLPLLALTADQYDRLQHGRFLRLDATSPKVGLTYDGLLKAVYRRDDGLYRPDVMYLSNEGSQTHASD
ncbi:tRNA pseudouridine(55) synthase TruB [Lacticaseibacillus baoqingensis]|uniref:tRNA pseudouridine synthase B n=1 Tax=Lacticaseibacillus baoqingensis TaxID=2486013 RepID=A0ABW4E761_9LACO|nr:tRNA pseudouridine(55) synthase TruB [Lacticaseibacillus baoqingensis]